MVWESFHCKHVKKSCTNGSQFDCSTLLMVQFNQSLDLSSKFIIERHQYLQIDNKSNEK